MTYSAKEKSGLAFFNTDLAYIFGTNDGRKLVVILIKKYLRFCSLHCLIQSLMINRDLIEYNTFADTEPLLLRCFPFISRLTVGNNITTGSYMNCQTFSNLKIKSLLNIFFSLSSKKLERQEQYKIYFLYLSVSLVCFDA